MGERCSAEDRCTQDRTTRRNDRRHAVLVALTLGALCTGALTQAATATAQGVADTAVAASHSDASWDEGTPDDTVTGTSLTLSFDAGVDGAIGLMDDVEVDTGGTWRLPAVCFVADGLTPTGWLVADPDASAPEPLPAGTTVEGLEALLPSPDGATLTMDLTPFVQDGTIELVCA